MKSGQEAEKAKAIAGSSRTSSATAAMGRKKLELGLAIPELAPEFEDRMWELWCDLEQEFKGREAFDPLAEVAKSREHAAVLFAGAPQVSIPANLPPQLMEAVLRTIVQNVGTITQLAPLDFETQQAVVESVRKASHFVTRGKILATRLPDLNVVTTIAPTETGWQNRILP
jgi:hypothetical protein